MARSSRFEVGLTTSNFEPTLTIMDKSFTIGVIGNGSWATALVKILTDNGRQVNWWIRKTDSIDLIRNRRHNPHYLSSAYFDVKLLHLSGDVNEVVKKSDLLVLAVPSAYIKDVLAAISPAALEGKKVLSAIKVLAPAEDVLLNDFEEIVFGEHNAAEFIKDELYKAGALFASMSGTGSTVYGLFEKGKELSFDFPDHYLVKSGKE